MRRLARLRELAGWLAVALMLALASPGVRAVRADDAAPRALPAGPACQAAAAGEPALPRMVRVDLSQLAKRPEAARVEALDTQGYHYDGEPAVDARGPSARVILGPSD